MRGSQEKPVSLKQHMEKRHLKDCVLSSEQINLKH